MSKSISKMALKLGLSSKLLLLSTLLVGVSSWSIRRASQTPLCSAPWIILGLIGVLTFSCSILLLWLLSHRTSPHHTVRTLLLHLLEEMRSQYRGNHLLRELRKAWRNPRAAQERYLISILKANEDTEYSRKYGLGAVKSREDFRKRHPLNTYEDYGPFVERAMKGESNVLTRRPFQSYVKTSGTTGPSKCYGHTDRARLFENILDIDYAIVREICPQVGRLQKRLMHYVPAMITELDTGGRIESALTLGSDWTMNSYSTPLAGFKIPSFIEANYIHLLFGLRDPNLGVFICLTSTHLDTMMKQLERWWPDIVRDIEHGTIRAETNLEDDIRKQLVAELRGGDGERARQLEREFKKGFDGIMKRVWPHLGLCLSIDTAQVWPLLREKYAKGLALMTWAYGCSEAMGVALPLWFWEDNKGLLFDINNIFFEFIKLEDTREKQPTTYFVDELEVDHAYEVVVSQASGLYRYRLGDVIRVTGFHDKCPTMEFMFRLGLILNLRYEKMNQQVAKQGLEAAVAQKPGVKLLEYAVAESLIIPESSAAYEKDEIMPYYLIFLELGYESKQAPDQKTAELYSSLIDAEFRDRNSDYERLRRESAISLPRVHLLKPGTFEDLKIFVLTTTGTSVNQYKVPRKIRTVEMLNLMFEHSDTLNGA